tara:strand:+ start:203 stop:388 length:186 start_codon:yes stop_codon:yes gene_type:complete
MLFVSCCALLGHGTVIKGIDKTPKAKIQMIQNIGLGLKFIQEQLKVSGKGLEDLKSSKGDE